MKQHAGDGHPASTMKRRVSIERSSVVFLFAFYLVMLVTAWQRVWWVPTPLAADADVAVFSEGRALLTTSVLADDIGDRAMTTPGNAIASQWLHSEALKLQAFAKEHRPDLDVHVDVEGAEGAVGMTLFHHRFTNAYKDVRNVVLVIWPKRLGASSKALLLNAHYDNTLGSPGASDCASCVGVIMEVARTAVASAEVQLAAPLVVLFNGAEETFLQASHCFAQSSKWAPRVGAFLNLESTGPGGPDVVFQHSGHWTISTYAASALYPRGSVIGQDIFDLGLLPADTDYRMFSHNHHGQWPGLDIAFLLDASAYHTDRDTTERIRAGTLQAAGNNLMAVVPAFTRQLAAGAAEQPRGTPRASVFMDFLSFFMVTWSPEAARWLHVVPLLAAVATAAAVGFPLASLAAGAARVMASLALCLLLPALVGVLRVAAFGKPMVWFGQHGVAYVIYVPLAIAGLLLPLLLHQGKSPFQLLVDLSSQPANRRERVRRQPLALPLALLEWSAGFGALAAVLTLGAGLASGGLFAIWAAAALIAAIITTQVHQRLQVLTAALVCAMPSLLMVSGALSYNTHVLDKLAMSGSRPPPVGALVADAVAGLLLGVGTLASVGPVTPAIAAAFGRRTKSLVVMALILSTSAATVASLMMQPYSLRHPQKIVINQVHSHGPSGMWCEEIAAMNGIKNQSCATPGSSEAGISKSVWEVSTFDSGPLERVLSHRTTPLKPQPTLPRPFQMLIPAAFFLRASTFEAPPPLPEQAALDALPAIQLIRTEQLTGHVTGHVRGEASASRSSAGSCAADSGSCSGIGGSNSDSNGCSGSGGQPRQRLHLRLQFPSAAWGLVNVTGPLLGWSFTHELNPAPPNVKGGLQQHLLRFAGNGGSNGSSSGGREEWQLWVDVPLQTPPKALRLEMAASMKSLYPAGVAHRQPPALLDFASQLPPWTAAAATESFQSAWAFP